MPFVNDSSGTKSKSKKGKPPKRGGRSVLMTSTLVTKESMVPAFYACYLLRSKKDGQFTNRTYVGSTPHPPRRIRQHNGEITQGAYKTRFWRPWEMELIVYGFPSKLVALQFEWAWQSPWLTRHLKHGPNQVAYFRKTSSGHNHPQLKVAVVQRMIVTDPWKRYNLRVMLFSNDAATWWRDAAVHGGENPRVRKRTVANPRLTIMDPSVPLPDVSRVPVTERFEGVDGNRRSRDTGELHPSIGPIEVDDWTFVAPHWKKWSSLTPPVSCGTCHKPIDTTDHLGFSLCIHDTCTATHHFQCLAPAFTPRNHIVPAAGTCPTCHTHMTWLDLLRGASRRHNVVNDLYKKRLKGAKTEEVDDDMVDADEPPVKKRRKKAAKVSTDSDADTEAEKRPKKRSPASKDAIGTSKAKPKGKKPETVDTATGKKPRTRKKSDPSSYDSIVAEVLPSKMRTKARSYSSLASSDGDASLFDFDAGQLYHAGASFALDQDSAELDTSHRHDAHMEHEFANMVLESPLSNKTKRHSDMPSSPDKRHKTKHASRSTVKPVYIDISD